MRFRVDLRWYLSLAAAAVLTMVGGASAQAPTALLTKQLDSPAEAFPNLEKLGPWLHVCEESGADNRCHYEQVVRASNGDEVSLTLLAPGSDGPRAPVALFRTPLYAFLPAGLRLTFDGATPGVIEYRACSPRGCIASVVLQGPIRSRVAGANRLAIQFTSQTMETISADFSLSRSSAILKTM